MSKSDVDFTIVKHCRTRRILHVEDVDNGSEIVFLSLAKTACSHERAGINIARDKRKNLKHREGCDVVQKHIDHGQDIGT